jgi:DNA-binding response OmpR family regulator
MKILLIEDSKFLSVATARALTKEGHSVRTAKDGEEGLRVTREIMPDLVLLDMMLPKIAGIDVLRLLKSDAATKHIPVVVLTALSERNTEKLLSLGAAGFVEKSETLLEKDAAKLMEVLRRVTTKAASAGV